MSGELRRRERASIRRFVESAGDVFRGRRVLDLGAGKQPYRDLVESFSPASYEPFDRVALPGNVSGEDVGLPRPLDPDGEFAYDVVLLTQVVQYVPEPRLFLDLLYASLPDGGHLVTTWPTNWPEVEETDLHRFTAAGMRFYLEAAGFVVERLERRESVVLEGETFALGYGAVARA